VDAVVASKTRYLNTFLLVEAESGGGQEDLGPAATN
jgi:hypothetical protein